MAAYLDFEKITKLATVIKKYQPISKHPPIIEDLSFIIKPKVYYSNLVQLIKSTSLIIQNVELIDSYKTSYTLRITYQNPKKNLTDKEVRKIRRKIISMVKQRGLGRLREKN